MWEWDGIMYGKSVGGGVGGVGSWQEVGRILEKEGESER